MYLYETHVHCARCSACASAAPGELVRAYKAAGYAGLVLTDHFIFGNTCVPREKSWAERMGCYRDAWEEARMVGEQLDFDVLFGIEHHYGAGKDLLFYGIDPEFLIANPDIPEIPVEELVRRVRAYGGLSIMAHPYRDRFYVDMSVGPNPALMDGLEVYNACNLPGENDEAQLLADRNPQWIQTSGGDIHRADDPRIGNAGILLPMRVRDSRSFAQALGQRQYTLLKR